MMIIINKKQIKYLNYECKFFWINSFPHLDF